MHWQLTKQPQYFRQKLQQISLRRFTSPCCCCCCWLAVIQLGSRFLWLITCSTEDHQDLRQAVHCCWSPSILTTTYNRSPAPIMKPLNNPNPQKEEKNCKKLRTRHQNPENQNTPGSQKWSNTYLIDRRHDQSPYDHPRISKTPQDHDSLLKILRAPRLRYRALRLSKWSSGRWTLLTKNRKLLRNQIQLKRGNSSRQTNQTPKGITNLQVQKTSKQTKKQTKNTLKKKEEEEEDGYQLSSWANKTEFRNNMWS